MDDFKETDEITRLVAELAKKDIVSAVGCVTGIFLGLMETIVRMDGGDPSLELVVDNVDGFGRRLTLSAAASPNADTSQLN